MEALTQKFCKRLQKFCTQFHFFCCEFARLAILFCSGLQFLLEALCLCGLRPAPDLNIAINELAVYAD
jgi:hypothetical protein